MKEYIERETLLKDLQEELDFVTPMYAEEQNKYFNMGLKCAVRNIKRQPTVDVVEAKHGEWNLEVHSFYMDTWDESSELCVYILASCSNCGKEHNPKEVFSKHIYAPEDADCDYRFDKEYEESKALEEFKQCNFEFQNYCSNCGAKMDEGAANE